MNVVYFRFGANLADDEEVEAAQRYFPIVRLRTEIPYTTRLVIPRYSALPFYEELEADVANRGCRLVNTYAQHRFVADVTAYEPLLFGITPRTWTSWSDLPKGAYVVKGRTNSRKHEWRDRMFAPTRADVPRVARSLLDDDLIRSQGLVAREYVPLVRLGDGINGLPISNEWRFFVLDGEIPVSGFYWASEPETCPCPETPDGAVALVQEAIRRVGLRCRFYVVDVAETLSGRWIVIELNDGQQSGPSMADVDLLYGRLAETLAKGRTE